MPNTKDSSCQKIAIFFGVRELVCVCVCVCVFVVAVQCFLHKPNLDSAIFFVLLSAQCVQQIVK